MPSLNCFWVCCVLQIAKAIEDGAVLGVSSLWVILTLFKLSLAISSRYPRESIPLGHLFEFKILPDQIFANFQITVGVECLLFSRSCAARNIPLEQVSMVHRFSAAAYDLAQCGPCSPYGI